MSIHKPSLGTCKVPQKIDVYWIQITNKQADRQTKYIDRLYTGLPTKDETSETTEPYLYFLFVDIHNTQQL